MESPENDCKLVNSFTGPFGARLRLTEVHDRPESAWADCQKPCRRNYLMQRLVFAAVVVFEYM
jgi:hypothetical protein